MFNSLTYGSEKDFKSLMRQIFVSEYVNALVEKNRLTYTEDRIEKLLPPQIVDVDQFLVFDNKKIVDGNNFSCQNFILSCCSSSCCYTKKHFFS